MRSDLLIAQAMQEPFFVKESVMENLAEFLTNGMKVAHNMQHVPNTANNSVTLQKITSNKNGKALAVLAIDGAMYKKDMSGFCMSVASYQKIQERTQEAKKMYDNGEIGLLVYRVTTPGGGVFGLDSVETMISRLDMPTATFAEDQLCSAGVYAFTATDKLYASPMTEIGSIGTVVEVKEDKKKKYKTVTSRRAKNKRLDLSTKEGMGKLKDYLNEYEDKFYEVVQKNTGFTAEQIEQEFDNGGTIMSEQAQKIGFVDEVMVFEDFIERELDNMGGDDTAMPSDNVKLVNSNQGVNMEFTQANFDALQEENKVLRLNKSTMETRLSTASLNLEEANAALDTKDAEMSAYKTDMESKLSEATASARVAVQEAFKMGVASEETILAMIEKPSEASAIALNAKEDNSVDQGDTQSVAKADAWAEFIPEGAK